MIITLMHVGLTQQVLHGKINLYNLEQNFKVLGTTNHAPLTLLQFMYYKNSKYFTTTQTLTSLICGNHLPKHISPFTFYHSVSLITIPYLCVSLPFMESYTCLEFLSTSLCSLCLSPIIC